MATGTAARKPLIAGNWKMNSTHLEAIALAQKLAFSLSDKDYDAVEIAVLPPFTSLRSVQTLVDGDRLRLRYGAQDLSPHPGGAYTGDVSGPMLAKLGCAYTVVGHSERRQHHPEDDDTVNAKTRAAFGVDLVPILCVGEPLEVREANRHVEYTLGQLHGALRGVEADQTRRLVVAYEPVWAIGTGRVCDPEDAQEVCASVRARLAELYDAEVAGQVRILYGGSVKAANIAGVMARPDIDGALVGGASLDPEEFVKICRYREHAA